MGGDIWENMEENVPIFFRILPLHLRKRVEENHQAT